MTTIELIANFSYIVSAALFIFGLKMVTKSCYVQVPCSVEYAFIVRVMSSSCPVLFSPPPPGVRQDG